MTHAFRALAALSLTTHACGGPLGAEQTSPTAGGEHPELSQTPAPQERWADRALLSQLTTVDARRSDEHFGVPLEVTIKANDTAQPGYRQLTADSTLPNGSLLAAEHRQNGQLRGILVMRKQNDAWQFLSLDGQLGVEPRPDPRCARCHAEGRADFLFGLPAAPLDGSGKAETPSAR